MAALALAADDDVDVDEAVAVPCRVREHEIATHPKDIEVAPGVVYSAWTYDGRVPGCALAVPRSRR